MKIIVLGAGLVGAPMAVDLAKDNNFSVTLVDRSSRALEKIRDARAADPANSQLPEALSPLTIVPAQRRWVSALGLDWLNKLLSTHPPLEQRIRRLSEMESAAGMVC